MKVKSLSHVRLLATPWPAAHQAPLPVGFSQAGVLEWVAIASLSFFWLRFNICVIFSSLVVTLVNGMIIWEGFGVDDNFLLQ